MCVSCTGGYLHTLSPFRRSSIQQHSEPRTRDKTNQEMRRHPSAEKRKKGRPGNLLAPRRVWHIRPSSPERGPPTSAIPVKGRSGVELAEKPHAQNFHQWQFHLLFWRRRRRALSNRVKVGGRVETDRTIRTTAWWWLVSVWANACFWAFSFRLARPSIHTPACVSTCKRTFVDLQ